jgi:hypothetical protein
VLDAADAGKPLHQTVFTFSSADWSDSTNASLVLVAPEIRSICDV